MSCLTFLGCKIKISEELPDFYSSIKNFEKQPIDNFLQM